MESAIRKNEVPIETPYVPIEIPSNNRLPIEIPYKPIEDTWYEKNIATIWAFIFAVLLTLIVILVIWVVLP